MARSTVESQLNLSNLAPLVMGGAGFSYQLHPKPESLPVREIVLRAFELGLRVIDTSPYYEPSEQLLGAALSHSDISNKYKRNEYMLMTKVGRIGESQFDYSPEWIRTSVSRSLQRFQTSYLDVVFCHDVEFVSEEEAVHAVGILFELRKTGVIKYVGISGYKIDTLASIAGKVCQQYGRSIDVIQNWAQLTLQNTRLEQHGLDSFRRAGVKAVCSSSPLAVGLLRSGGVPIGARGNWHPAPPGLRNAAQKAAEWVEEQGDSLASLALRFAISRAQLNSDPGFTVTTVTGISSISDLEQNVQTTKYIFGLTSSNGTLDSSLTLKSYEFKHIDSRAVDKDEPLYKKVRAMLGPWIDYDFDKKEAGVNTTSDIRVDVDRELISRI